jgi:hypothetical protein
MPTARRTQVKSSNCEDAELDARITARRDAAKQTRRYAAKAAPENESAAPQSYFRATGFNVSLKKTLVFEGNYAAPPANSQLRRQLTTESERSKAATGPVSWERCA